MRISDWSSDVCSSDLGHRLLPQALNGPISSRQVRRAAAHTVQRVLGSSLLRGRASEIGRASCRESVSVRVDLGGRRIIKKKNKKRDSREITQKKATNR